MSHESSTEIPSWMVWFTFAGLAGIFSPAIAYLLDSASTLGQIVTNPAAIVAYEVCFIASMMLVFEIGALARMDQASRGAAIRNTRWQLYFVGIAAFVAGCLIVLAMLL